MISISEILSRYGKKQVLLVIVGALVAINLVKVVSGFYVEQQEELAQNIALLEKYQKSTAKIDMLRKRVKLLEQQNAMIDSYLFKGNSEEEIASAIQILLQDLVVKAGMDPESLRPTTGVGMDRSRDPGEISVKMRLSGNMQGFITLLGNLYKSKKLFKIESFTVKPYKKTELKVFMELKGFYSVDTEKGQPEKKG